jgi:hypothetical protein
MGLILAWSLWFFSEPFPLIQVHATANDVRNEGRIVLTVEVDYNTALQALRQSHAEQVRQSTLTSTVSSVFSSPHLLWRGRYPQLTAVAVQHAAQLEEMEALHLRGMAALRRDLSDGHREETARREREFQAQVSSW